MGRNLPPSQLIPEQPSLWGGLLRRWRRWFPKPHDFTVRYFVSYDYQWKQFHNGQPRAAMGHCVLEVADGGIDSWQKVCAVQGWITQSVMRDTQFPILTEVRINNFIPLTSFIPNDTARPHPQQQPV